MTRLVACLLLYLWSISSGCTGDYYSDAEIAGTFDPEPVTHSVGADTLPLNLEGSTIAWKGTKLWGRGMHTGTVDIREGYLLMENNRISGGRVTADMRSIGITDIPPDQPEPINTLTGHLEDEVFFHVEEYPRATFFVTDIEYLSNDSLSIHGNLTVRDVTKNIAFAAEIDSTFSAETVSFRSRFKIDRFEWGIAYTGGFGEDFFSPRNFVDTYIELDIRLVPEPQYLLGHQMKD